MRHLPATIAVILLTAGPAFAQDEAAGRRAFGQCGICHQVGPTARSIAAPTLNGLFGRRAGSVEGFKYSEAMQNSGLVWDEDTFRTFISDPQGVVPGTIMAFRGTDDPERIKNLIAYLKQFE
jgi:cytochrome c